MSATPATNLALSVDEKLALRLGLPDSLLDSSRLPAAICDPRTETLYPLVPDEACIDTWIDFLVRTVVRNRREGAANPGWSPRSLRRLDSLMPLIEETTGDNPPANRLRRIGNIGLAVLGSQSRRSPTWTGWTNSRPLDMEAACLFFALTRRYEAAQACLARISPAGIENDRRCRLYALTAQLSVAAGKVHEGALILEALGSGESRDIGQIASDGRGAGFEPPVPNDWQAYLEN